MTPSFSKLNGFSTLGENVAPIGKCEPNGRPCLRVYDTVPYTGSSLMAIGSGEWNVL